MNFILDKSISILRANNSDTSLLRAQYQSSSAALLCRVNQINDEVSEQYEGRKIPEAEFGLYLEKIKTMMRRLSEKSKELERLGFKYSYKKNCDK